VASAGCVGNAALPLLGRECRALMTNCACDACARPPPFPPSPAKTPACRSSWAARSSL
jgi:hypothetical protein